MLIGRRLPRLEDDRLLTGKGRFTDDVALPGQLWCAFVRSPHPRARITRLDGKKALESNALAVLTGEDYAADGLEPMNHIPNPMEALDINRRAFDGPLERRHWPLARGEARHVGEPVAAVIAESREASRDAAERIEVEYEPLPPERTQCFERAMGDKAAVTRALAEAALVVRHEFVNQRIASCTIEPRSAVGEYREGRYTLITGSQGVHRMQQILAEIFSTSIQNVRVLTEDVGGSFGTRAYLHPEQAVVVWAARRLGRPVKWTAERAEAFISDFQGRDAVIRAALGLDGEGHILAYDVDAEANVGAHTVSFVPMVNFKNILTTVYRVPAAHVEVRGVITNTLPAVPFRGAGRPEANHVIERLLDMAARRLGMDRVEIRRRNLVRKGDLPYRTPAGLVFDSGDFRLYMERAIQLAEYDSIEKRKGFSKAKGRLRGIGIANYVEAPVGAPRERVELKVEGEHVEIVVGTQSSGQGHETSFAQVAADILGVPIERVHLRTGDTDVVAIGGGTHSDRSMRLAGTLLFKCAHAIIEKGRQLAAETLEARAEEIVFENGAYRIAGTDRAVSILQLSVQAGEDFNGRMPAYPAGAAVCEVEVDPQTGGVDVVSYAAVDDVGHPINPMIVEGQGHGAIAQGVGQALMEGVAFAADQILNGSFADYAIARSEDLPAFRCELVEDPTGANPLRVKGGGEGGIVPATPALINALCDALGVEDIAMPATPQRIWRSTK
jgi:aerobic carbon-monoxide dehydrogenase large subunit